MSITVTDTIVDGLIFDLTDEHNPARSVASREKLMVWLDDATLTLTKQQREKIEAALVSL